MSLRQQGHQLEENPLVINGDVAEIKAKTYTKFMLKVVWKNDKSTNTLAKPLSTIHGHLTAKALIFLKTLS